MIPSQPLYYFLLTLLIGLFVLYWTNKKLMSKSLHENKITYAEILAVCCVVVIGIIAVYFNILFGDAHYAYTDIGSDTIQQYIPFYLDLVNDIRNGTFSWWNFDYGLGVSMFKYQSWLFDPFNIILIPGCLFFGDASLPFWLMGIHAIKILLCAILFDVLLQFYCTSPVSRITGAAIFAFNGFLMLWGSHYWFGNACLACVSILLCIEYCLKSITPRHLAALAITTAFTLIWSVYVGFAVMVFAAAYGFIRAAIFHKTAIGYFKHIFPIAVAVIIGCLVSCIALVPTASMLLGDTTRISQDVPLLERAATSLGVFSSYDTVFITLTRFLGTNLVATGYDQYPILNYYEVAQISCSCSVFVFFFLFVHWLIKSTSGKLKLLTTLPIVLVFFYIINEFLPQLFNVFSGLVFRSSFVIIALLCIMIAFTLDKAVIPRRVNLSTLLIGSGISLVLITAAAINATHYARRVCIVMAILLIVFTLCIALYQTKAWKKALMIALGAVFASVLFDAYVTVNLRGIATDETFPVSDLSGKNQDTERALEYLHEIDSSLYRIEKTYTDWTSWEDSLVQHYSGVSIYCSTLPGGLQEFNRIVWPETLYPDEAYQSITLNPNHPGALSFLGVKYLLSRSELDYSWLELTQTEDEIYIYRNTLANSMAGLYTSFISQSDYASLPSDERDLTLENTLVVTDSDYGELSNLQKGTSQNEKGSIDIRKTENNVLEGSVDVASGGTAAIAIPYTAGWTVFVDGNVVDIEQVNYGFIGFRLDTGYHAIRIVYEPFGWTTGAILSLTGIIMLICMVLTTQRISQAENYSRSVTRKKHRPKKRNKNDEVPRENHKNQ